MKTAVVLVIAFLVGCVATFWVMGLARFRSDMIIIAPLIIMSGISLILATIDPGEAKAVAIWMSLVPVLVFSFFFIEIWREGREGTVWGYLAMGVIISSGGGAWVGYRLATRRKELNENDGDSS